MSHPQVGLRVDAHPATGVGHAVRLLALSQELLARGASVTVFGELEVPWVARDFAAAGIELRPADEITDAALSHAVIDGYDIPATVGTALRARGVRVLAMVDGPFGAQQEADVYVDQNYGARPRLVDVGQLALAGVECALFRDEVLRARSPRPRLEVPRLLVVFGGSDPYAACPELAALALRTSHPVEVIAVAATDAIAERLVGLDLGEGQTVEIVRNPPDLPALASTCTAAISAAGSTIWELLCLGVPTASVCVVDNQEQGYAATNDAGLTVPGGRLPRLRGEDAGTEQQIATDSIRALLTDTDLRAAMAVRGQALVDGRGRERVADALLS